MLTHTIIEKSDHLITELLRGSWRGLMDSSYSRPRFISLIIGLDAYQLNETVVSALRG